MCALTAGALNQQQLAGMNNPLAQMQLLQPMGTAGVPPGMAAAGVHPGVAGAQGMMWPINAANMQQQANLAQLMQLQQQQQVGQPVVAGAAGQQPAVSQPPAG